MRPHTRPTARVSLLALAATILTAGSGCDKPSAAAAPPAAAADSASAALERALAARPPVLYQVFGGRGDPRMLPVAALVAGRIQPLTLTAEAWQRFDSLYHRPGTVYTVYQDGRPAGSARVTRPMWDDGGEPLYVLPHCRQPTPLAAVNLKAPPPIGFFVEHLATNLPVGRDAPTARPVRHAAAGDVLAEARTVAGRVAEAAGIEPAVLAGLDFRARAVTTRAGASPTLVIAFVDPAAATAQGDASHLFILADHGPDGYVPTYTRLVRAGQSSAHYRRYVDHLDLTGDGADELVLEGWSSGRESYLLILQQVEGRWTEVFHGGSSWCLD